MAADVFDRPQIADPSAPTIPNRNVATRGWNINFPGFPDVEDRKIYAPGLNHNNILALFTHMQAHPAMLPTHESDVSGNLHLTKHPRSTHDEVIAIINDTSIAETDFDHIENINGDMITLRGFKPLPLRNILGQLDRPRILDNLLKFYGITVTEELQNPEQGIELYKAIGYFNDPSLDTFDYDKENKTWSIKNKKGETILTARVTLSHYTDNDTFKITTLSPKFIERIKRLTNGSGIVADLGRFVSYTARYQAIQALQKECGLSSDDPFIKGFQQGWASEKIPDWLFQIAQIRLFQKIENYCRSEDVGAVLFNAAESGKGVIDYHGHKIAFRISGALKMARKVLQNFGLYKRGALLEQVKWSDYAKSPDFPLAKYIELHPDDSETPPHVVLIPIKIPNHHGQAEA